MTEERPQTVEEYRLAQVEQRLSAGAGRFSELDGKMDDISKRNGRMVVGVASGLFVVALGIAVSVGVLLNRVDTTSTTQEKHETKLEQVQKDVAEVKDAVEDVAKSVDEKLDRALRAVPAAAPATDPLGRKGRR